MKASIVLLVVAACMCLFSATNGQSVGETVGNLPPEIAADLLSMLIDGTVQILGNCANSDDVSEMKYLLYTRQNSPIILTSLDQIDASKKTIIIVPGWISDADSPYIAVLREAYLERYDCNLIIVQQSAYTFRAYQTSYCYTPAMGQAIAQFVCDLESAGKVNVSDMHLVSHSLGGHISGFAGQATKTICGKTIGRITGLDPAGPLYQGVSTSNRLDESDAALVDVIHTDQGKLGFVGNLGSVDFYPNCGVAPQPGCFNEIITSMDDIVNLAVTVASCSHTRSTYLFAESINRNGFKAKECLVCGLPLCLANPSLAQSAHMGESCRSKPAKPDYYLQTYGDTYYGKGPVIALS